MPRLERTADLSVIGGAARIIAPAILGAERLDRAGGARRRSTVRAIQNATQRQQAGRRRSIPLHLETGDSGTPECRMIPAVTQYKQPVRAENRFLHSLCHT